MRSIDTTTTCLSHVLIIVFLVISRSEKSIYADEYLSDTMFILPVEDLEAICDDEYRSKYMDDENDEDPSEDGLQERNATFTTSEADFVGNSFEKGSSEFMEHDPEFQNFTFMLRNRFKRAMFYDSSRNEIKSHYDFEDRNKRRKINREDRDSVKRIRRGKMKIGDNLCIRRSRKLRKNLKKKNNEIGSNIYDTNFDTFGSIVHGRRQDSSNNELKFHDPLDGWSDACTSVRRIIGGWPPESAETFPYIAFIDTGCGGVVIGNIWVLTAAHCLDEDRPRYVYAGSLELLGGCQFNVDQVFIHPKYTRKALRYDIGLLTVRPEFTYSPAIKPIPLAKYSAHRGMCGVVCGWGTNQYKGAPSYRLLMSRIPVVSRKKCSMFRIQKGQFCAGYKDARADTCQGDSGGPFVVRNRVVGLVSYGFECATRETPAVYVDIHYYRNWIRSVSGIRAL